jgi:hypothetical protein
MSLVEIIPWIIIWGYVCFFLGYVIGRRIGKKEGFNEGSGYAPILVREQSYNKGYCVICGEMEINNPMTDVQTVDPKVD